jgi:superfamily I DNA/RNA helicase
MMLPEETWPTALRQFAAKWKPYKISIGALDFCDLIQTALHEISFAPKRPDVIFTDEAQDLNPMQLKLVRRWGDHAQYFIIAADDDQTIYSWCGATPDAVSDPPIPDDHKITLKQTYRIPRSIHTCADWLIRQVSRREEKTYEARPDDGLLMRLSHGGYKSPEYWILKALMQHIEKDQTVMLLSSCSYMLHPVIAALRKWGIPFHNPFRKSNGFWNPLRSGKRGSSVNRLLALLAGSKCDNRCFRWTHRDLKLWTEWLKLDGSVRLEAKALIDETEASLPVTVERLAQLFRPDALHSLLTACEDPRQLTDWWCRRVAPTFHSRVQFASAVVSARGSHALRDKPHVTVGTIHSVKGGEADVVFLFPDLSSAGNAAYQRPGPTRDSVIRLFYVGMTRARHTLYICQKESSKAVTI